MVHRAKLGGYELILPHSAVQHTPNCNVVRAISYPSEHLVTRTICGFSLVIK